MVFVAQSGERRFVEPKVVGSKPTIHPNSSQRTRLRLKVWVRTSLYSLRWVASG